MLYQVCVSWSHFQCLAFISFLFALQQHQSSSSVLDCRVEPSQTERNQSSTPPRVHRFISLSTSRVESSRTEGREGGALQGWWRTIDDPKGEQRGKTGGVGSSHNPPQWKAFLFFLYHFPILIFLFFFSYRKGDFNGGVVSYYVYRPPPPSPPRCWHWNRMYTLPPFQIFRPFLFLLVT